jgi:negative regulator of flagellin synthesis FlgM
MFLEVLYKALFGKNRFKRKRGLKMKINRYSLPQVNPYQKDLKRSVSISRTNTTKDRVEISSTAKQMQQASSLNQERQSKIKQLKTQVQNGNYKIDHQSIAKSIVKYYSLR